MEDQPSSSASEDAIQGPLVFSCSKCRTIVGDSFSYLSSHEEMKTITLTAASSIQRSADVYTSKTGEDVGSTYFSFTCLNCQAPLGRYYLTTSRDLDELREKFTFTCEGISSYQLGKSQHGKMPEPTGLSEIAAPTSTSSVDLQTMEQTVSGLNEEVLKIQHVFFGMQQRLEMLEQHLGLLPPGMMGAMMNGYLEDMNSTVPPPHYQPQPSSLQRSHQDSDSDKKRRR